MQLMNDDCEAEVTWSVLQASSPSRTQADQEEKEEEKEKGKKTKGAKGAHTNIPLLSTQSFLYTHRPRLSGQL